MTEGRITLIEDVQCPACKSYKTFAVDKRLRYCRSCKKSFTRRRKAEVEEGKQDD